jgi:hypothetical protein
MAEAKTVSPLWHAGALAFYALLSWLIIDHGANLTGVIFGHDADAFAFLWFIEWLPYALTHHLNPLVTHLVWQPMGLALLWMSAVPVLALLAAPLTMTIGPMATYNALVLLAPVLAAWCMYRFCLRVAPSPPAALAGGFLFGFSTYEMAQVSTLNLSYIFLLPCLGWILLARAQGGLRRPAAVVLLVLAAVSQFLLSTEIFAMTAVFGAMFFGLAFAIAPGLRPALRRGAADLLIAGPIVLVLLSPLLVSMFAVFPYIHLPKLWPYYFSASPTGFFVPGPNTWASWAPGYGLINVFAHDVQEQDSYLGLPLLAIFYLYARENRALPTARVLIVMLAVLLVFSLGPHLWLGQGYTMIRLPWVVLMRLPLLNSALPVRFAMFVSFIAGIITVLWICARPPGAQPRRLAAAFAACAVIFPAPHTRMQPPNAAFFAPGREESVLGPARQILILPFSLTGDSTYWQFENGFGFSQTGGYLGFPPRAMQHFQAVWELTAQKPGGVKVQDVADFVQETKADYIVAGPGTPGWLIATLATLHWPERRVDDVTIFDVPKSGAAGGAGG